jgi:transcriptional regulator with XRE-family HTH domain
MKHETINDRVKALRAALGRTQNEFSNELEISLSLYSKIEVGEKEVSPKLIDRIKEYYQVPHEWLINGKGEMKFVKPTGQKFDPATDTLYRELKEQIAFYRNLLTQMAGGKSFRTALSLTGSRRRATKRLAA